MRQRIKRKSGRPCKHVCRRLFDTDILPVWHTIKRKLHRMGRNYRIYIIPTRLDRALVWDINTRPINEWYKTNLTVLFLHDIFIWIVIFDPAKPLAHRNAWNLSVLLTMQEITLKPTFGFPWMIHDKNRFLWHSHFYITRDISVLGNVWLDNKYKDV